MSDEQLPAVRGALVPDVDAAWGDLEATERRDHVRGAWWEAHHRLAGAVGSVVQVDWSDAAWSEAHLTEPRLRAGFVVYGDPELAWAMFKALRKANRRRAKKKAAPS